MRRQRTFATAIRTGNSPTHSPKHGRDRDRRLAGRRKGPDGGPKVRIYLPPAGSQVRGHDLATPAAPVRRPAG